jgi:hypothetical protein
MWTKMALGPTVALSVAVGSVGPSHILLAMSQDAFNSIIEGSNALDDVEGNCSPNYGMPFDSSNVGPAYIACNVIGCH